MSSRTAFDAHDSTVIERHHGSRLFATFYSNLLGSSNTGGFQILSREQPTSGIMSYPRDKESACWSYALPGHVDAVRNVRYDDELRRFVVDSVWAL